MLELSQEEAQEVVLDDHPDFFSVPATREIVDQTRWGVVYSEVYEHEPAGKFYQFTWEEPSTEAVVVEEKYPITWVEVEQVERTIKVWVEK